MFDKKEYMKEYCQKEGIKENRRKYNKQWLKNNREKKLKQNGRHYQKYKDRMIKEAKEYYQNHKKEIAEYCKRKYKTDFKYNLNSRIKNEINRSLKYNKKGRKWENLVGYTVDDLLNHLEKTMPKSYTWQDFLEGRLHIDHIIPKSVFNYTKSENPDFKKCWALSNLRLLPAKENKIKFNKLDKPFQPALQLC